MSESQRYSFRAEFRDSMVVMLFDLAHIGGRL
jgi:hypothetical protein